MLDVLLKLHARHISATKLLSNISVSEQCMSGMTAGVQSSGSFLPAVASP